MRLDIQQVEEAIDIPFKRWGGNCHSVSLAIVKSGLIEGPCRVARGWCEGVVGQHSWIVLGKSCYLPETEIIDPTLWSYDSKVDGIWYGSMMDGRHLPHGLGSIFDWGMPVGEGGEHIELDLPEPSAAWMTLFPKPHDKAFWSSLLGKAPVQGWPAGEIMKAAYADERLRALIPMDRLGMNTDINPGGLYLPEE